jgi:hypothetical protein
MTKLHSKQSPGLALDAAGRLRLAKFADVLISGGEGFPSPSELQIEDTWMDRAVDTWPAMIPTIEMIVAMDGEPADILDTIQIHQPTVFGGFALIVSGAYLMHPKVRSLLGYDGHAPKANPPLEGEWEYYLEDDLLAPVLARGSFLRSVSEEVG